MATVLEVMAKLSGNSSGMVQSFLQAQNAARRHATEQESAAEQVGGALKSMALKAGAALGGVALAYTAAQGAMAARASEGDLIAKMGISPEDAKTAAKIAGAVYADNWGESLGEVVDATARVGQALGGVADEGQLRAITADALAFSSAFGVDTVESVKAAETMVRTGLSPSITDAYNLMAAGAQKGLNANGDLFDTLNEYGVQFQAIGLDGQTALGLISQGMKAGARDTDYISDALKEFAIRAKDGTESTAEGFKALGLDAEKMGGMIARGGTEGNEALTQTLARLREMKDPVAQSAAAVALFGTKAEDLGASLFALDPTTAVAALGGVEGAMSKVRDGMSQAATPVELLQRKFETTMTGIGVSFLPVIDQAATFAGGIMDAMSGIGPAITNVSSFIATDLVPALQDMGKWFAENQTAVTIVAGIITALLLPVFVTLGVAATISAAQQVAAWALSGAGAVKTSALYVVASYQIVASWVRQGAAAVVSGAQTAIIWGMYQLDAIKAAATMVANSARIVGAWVLMGVQSMVQAARMAAAWFIALGPIGWVIAALVGLAVLIAANWDSVVQWTTEAWTNVSAAITTIWSAVSSWLEGAVRNVVDSIVGAWTAFSGFISGIFNGIRDFIVGVWTWIFNLLTAIGQAFWAEHGAQLTAAWAFIVSIFTAIVAFYVSVWATIINTVVAAVTWIVNAVVTAFTTVYNGIVTALSAAWEFISTIWNNVMGFLAGVFAAIGAAVAAAWNFYVALITGALAAVWGVISSVFTTIWGFISAIWTTVGSFIAGVWASIMGVVSGVTATIAGIINGWVSAAWAVISSTFSNILGFLGGVWGGIVSGVSGMVGQVGSFFGSIWGTITGIFSGAGQWLWNAGVNIVQGLINGVKSLAGSIGSAFLSMVPGWIVGPFKTALGIASPSKLFHQFGRWIIKGLGLGVNAEEGTAVKAMEGAAAAVTAAGSGIRVAAPVITLPKVPRLDTSMLAVDPIMVQVRLDASAFEAAANKLTVGDMRSGLSGGVSVAQGGPYQGPGLKSREALPQAQQIFHITNYNPVAEPTSKTVEKAQDVAALGGII